VSQPDEIDSLSSLEERITRAVELVAELRREKADLLEQLEAANSSAAQSQKYQQELEDLRKERKQVRTRIEKLLGQMDLLSAT
jgi:FtsZ-binding cell division protein ZapB